MLMRDAVNPLRTECMYQDTRATYCVEFVLNPAGKSHICVLHEYAQHAMRIQPRYVFEELGLCFHR